jgi:hypothetical protein
MENIIILLIILIILRLAYRLLLKPYLTIQFYKHQGAECICFLGIGFGKTNYDGLLKHKDCFFYKKELAQLKPNTRTWATNLGKNVILHILDPQLLHEFYKLQGTDASLIQEILIFCGLS